MAALLDVNALIALVDSEHLSHQAMRTWFTRHHRSGWATCPLTENGMVRVLSQPAYPSGQRTPAEVMQILLALEAAFENSHQFWADDISILDNALFDATLVVGPRQVTDIYLLGLAAHHGGTVISFDRALAWQAVRGASRRLVQHPG